MIDTTMLKELQAAKMNYDKAIASQMGINVAKTRLMNLLFDAREELLAAAGRIPALEEEIDALDRALREASAEKKKAQKKEE